MITEVDSFVQERLEKVKFGDTPVTVYPYIPEREKGQSIFPCYAFIRDEIEIREDDKRPDCELFIPNETEVTVTIDPVSGETQTGTDGYTWKPYPSPVDIYYEIHCLATNKQHYDNLVALLIQTFPPGYIATINEQRVLFSRIWNKNQDDLDIPLYRGITLLKASDIWLDRLEAEEFKSIQQIIFADDIDETAIIIGEPGE